MTSRRQVRRLRPAMDHCRGSTVAAADSTQTPPTQVALSWTSSLATQAVRKVPGCHGNADCHSYHDPMRVPIVICNSVTSSRLMPSRPEAEARGPLTSAVLVLRPDMELRKRPFFAEVRRVGAGVPELPLVVISKSEGTMKGNIHFLLKSAHCETYYPKSRS